MKRLLILAAIVACAFSCTPAAPDPTLEISGKTEYSVSRLGDQISVNFTTNYPDDWGYDLGGADWIEATKGEGVLTLKVAENDVYEQRKATVSIFAPESGTAQARASVQIVQSARMFEPEVSVEVTDGVLSIASDAFSVTLPVTTNLETVTASSDAEWLTVSLTGMSLSLSGSANVSELGRSAKVTLNAEGEKGTATTLFTVKQSAPDVTYELEDLSSSATSNCYVITHYGSFCFNATVKGNGKGCTGLKTPESIAPVKAGLVWQSVKNMITSVEYKDGKVYFEAARGIAGNALLAVYNDSDKILWSWHIWRPEVALSAIKSTSGAQVMNINLGAVTDDYKKLGCYGLLYQWGRKDPFPGSDRMNGGTTAIDNVPVYDMDGKVVDITYSSMTNTSSNTLAYSISHPTVCIAGEAQKTVSDDWLVPEESNKSLWGNPDGDSYDYDTHTYPNKGTKTYFDPCPVGWRVPHIQVMHHMSSLGSLVWATGDSEGVMKWGNLGGEAEFQAVDINKDGYLNLLDFQNGWWIYLDKSHGLYSFYPATSRYYGYWGQFMGSMVGYWGNYWTNSPSLNKDGSDSSKGIAVAFGIKEYGGSSYSVTATPTAQGCRCDGFAIRCIKE